MEKLRFIAKMENPLTERRGLAVAHGILVAAEQIASACRVMDLLMEYDRNPADKAAIWCQFFGAASGVAELRARLIRSKVQEQAARKYLNDSKPHLVPVFDRLTARQIGDDLPLKLCCFARTNYSGFWNEEISAKFVEILSLDGFDPPVMETSEDQKSAGVPWVKEAWMQGWRQEFNLSDAKLKAQMPDIKMLMRDAAKTGRYAGIAILQSCGVQIEKVGGAVAAEV